VKKREQTEEELAPNGDAGSSALFDERALEEVEHKRPAPAGQEIEAAGDVGSAVGKQRRTREWLGQDARRFEEFRERF
jgi:hypothetical protein